jgi:hypothetical protein
MSCQRLASRVEVQQCSQFFGELVHGFTHFFQRYGSLLSILLTVATVPVYFSVSKDITLEKVPNK